jgi:anti-sigma factor RsiW
MRQPPNFGTGDRLIMSQPGRSQELIQKYFDELASEDELLELEQLLASEPDAAALFAETARLHAGLHDLFRKQYKIDQVAALLDSSDALALPVPPTKPSPGHEDSADSRPAGSTSDSAFIPIPKHLVGRRRERFRFVVPAIPWKWIGTAALLLAVTLGGWLWVRRRTATCRRHDFGGRAEVVQNP